MRIKSVICVNFKLPESLEDCHENNKELNNYVLPAISKKSNAFLEQNLFFKVSTALLKSKCNANTANVQLNIFKIKNAINTIILLSI